jgi:pyruvate dehydrogenase E2 component (dihydrolipoamide acetyltransferase)
MGAITEIFVPDIGDFKDIPVIELLVKPGDIVSADQSLITLESDKATLDVPSPMAGTIKEIKVKLGDNVSRGSLIVLMETGEAAVATAPVTKAAETPTNPPPAVEIAATPSPAPTQAVVSTPARTDAAAMPGNLHMPTPAETAVELAGGRKAHASPSVRQFARVLGVDVAKISGSGIKGRITQQDVEGYVKNALTQVASPSSQATAAGGFNVLAWPKIDFSKFGPTESKPLTRIQKISGANLHRNWVMIPHVTNFEEADITDLEAFRLQLNKENEKKGVKVSMLAFMIKAVVTSLKQFPNFNASLDGDNLVLKQYFHIGFAADTPNGLVVPVIRDADRKGILDIAKEMAELAGLAREGKLKAEQMQGGCFSISSLGGIGGTGFTPIINAPEVAIMGVCKSVMKPVWDGKAFVPRLILPLSLSWDHRVIDGAAAARFNLHFAGLLADMRRTLI